VVVQSPEVGFAVGFAGCNVGWGVGSAVVGTVVGSRVGSGVGDLGRFFVAAFSAGMMWSPSFQNWYVAACFHRYDQCAVGYWPLAVVGHGVSLEHLYLYTKVFLQRVATMIAVLAVVGSWVRPLKRCTPCFAEFLLGVGRRTLYVYLLHWALWIIPSSRTGFHALVNEWILRYQWNRDVFDALVAVVITFALGSRLTELSFRWMTETPIWIAMRLSTSFIKGGENASALSSRGGS